MFSLTSKGKENPLEKSPCPFLASGDDRTRHPREHLSPEMQHVLEEMDS